VLKAPAAKSVRPAARAAWDLAVSDQPIEWAADLAAADAAWHKGEWTAAKDLLAKGLGEDFPSRGHGLPAALTEALFFVGSSDDPVSAKRYRQLSSLWQKLFRIEKPPQAWMLACLRYFLIAEEPNMPPRALIDDIGELLRIESAIHGRNPLRDSQGWQWLGEQLSKVKSGSMFQLSPQTITRDIAGAIRAFESAKKSDPDNEAAWLGLLAAYEKKKSLPNRNRLLDEMVSLFPENKYILIRAGALAVERGAFAKGIGYLEHARKLDPLDPAVRSHMLLALLQNVRVAHQKGKKTEELWAQIEPLLDASPACADLVRAKWAMRVRQSLLDPANAQSARADAELLAPSPMEFLAFESLLSGCYGLALPKGWHQAWLRPTPATWHAITGVVHIISFADRIKDFEKGASRRAGEILVDIVNFAARDDLYVKDPSGALKVFRLLEHLEESANYTMRRILDNAQEQMFEALRKLPKKAVQADLHLRLLNLELREAYGSNISDAKSKKDLRSFIADAEKAGAANLANAARRLLVEIEEDWGAPDYYDEDEFGDEDIDFDISPDFSTTAKIARLISECMEAATSGDSKRVSEIEKELAKLGMLPPVGPRPKKPSIKPAKKPAKKSAKESPQKPAKSNPTPIPKPADAQQQEFGFPITP